MGKQTPLYNEHVALGAKIVDFAGWDMPLHYGSQIDEHNKVRNGAGMFDVSHMAVIDLEGSGTRDFLRHLLANNIDRLQQYGKALYTCMLTEQGGVIDDLIIFYLSDSQYRLVVNAGTRDKDMAWIEKQAGGYDVNITERSDVAMIAAQGPDARDKVHAALGELAMEVQQLEPFNGMTVGTYFISRTGYTGEDGYEIIVPNSQAVEFWQSLHAVGMNPIGLGARDTLRLEAGMDLYGTDMDETTTPMEAGLTWTVGWEPADRDFIGRAALESKRNDATIPKLVGLILEGRGVLRSHQKVFVDGKQVGEVTSGSFSPVLGNAIAFARVIRDVKDSCLVEIRGKQLPARIVKPPFVRQGKACF